MVLKNSSILILSFLFIFMVKLNYPLLNLISGKHFILIQAGYKWDAELTQNNYNYTVQQIFRQNNRFKWILERVITPFCVITQNFTNGNFTFHFCEFCLHCLVVYSMNKWIEFYSIVWIHRRALKQDSYWMYIMAKTLSLWNDVFHIKEIV